MIKQSKHLRISTTRPHLIGKELLHCLSAQSASSDTRLNFDLTFPPDDGI